MSEDDPKLVTIYSTMDKVKALIAKSMLNDAGIAYTISGAVLGS